MLMESFSLLRKNWELLPLLTLLIATGVVVWGRSAMFLPLTKNPNTSLNSEFTNSLYSSDENTYRNETTWLAEHWKSNSRIVASCVKKPGMSASRAGSPGVQERGRGAGGVVRTGNAANSARTECDSTVEADGRRSARKRAP